MKDGVGVAVGIITLKLLTTLSLPPSPSPSSSCSCHHREPCTSGGSRVGGWRTSRDTFLDLAHIRESFPA